MDPLYAVIVAYGVIGALDLTVLHHFIGVTPAHLVGGGLVALTIEAGRQRWDHRYLMLSAAWAAWSGLSVADYVFLDVLKGFEFNIAIAIVVALAFFVQAVRHELPALHITLPSIVNRSPGRALQRAAGGGTLERRR
jgi:hypothetical protein